MQSVAKMKLEWLSPTSESWRSHLSHVEHDVYHRPEYVAAEADRIGGLPIACKVQDSSRSLFLPLIMRPIENSDSWDVTSPQGYPGPLVVTPGENAFAAASFSRDAMDLTLQEMRQRKIVSCFVRCHPFLRNGLAGMQTRGTSVDHGSTVYIDLDQTEEQIWRQTRASHRSEINQCKKQGFKTFVNCGWDRLDHFIEMYYDTMRRVSATADYFYPREYFEWLRDQLSDHLFLSMTLIDGIPASGGIFAKCGGLVQYHLGATANEFYPQHPSKLLLDCTRRWAKRNGYHRMHLGGGASCRPDALLRFKLGFSKLRQDFQTIRYVVDEAKYRALTSLWSQECGEPIGEIEGFFPAYRKYVSANNLVAPRKPQFVLQAN